MRGRALRFNKVLRLFFVDRRGITALEFALTLPAVLVLYLGSVEVTQAISTQRMVDLAASTVTNLVAQYSTINSSTDMPDILKGSELVLAPYATTDPSIVITCISIDKGGNATVKWSQALNGSGRKAGDPITLPAQLDKPNMTIVLGEVSYLYTPVLDYLGLGAMTLTASSYMFPRVSSTINLR